MQTIRDRNLHGLARLAVGYFGGDSGKFELAGRTGFWPNGSGRKLEKILSTHPLPSQQ
jgi:hypothetical protein